jgi:hypothetical protein
MVPSGFNPERKSSDVDEGGRSFFDISDGEDSFKEMKNKENKNPNVSILIT